MDKLVKRTVKYSLIFLSLLIVALLAAPFFINVNDYKSVIVNKVEQATGRDVSIGDLHASLFPWVGVRMDNVRLANRPGFSGGNFLQVKSLDVRLALLPLLSRQVEIKRFVMDGPKLLLERDAGGAGNWEDLLPGTKSGKPQSSGGVSGPASGSSAPAMPRRVDHQGASAPGAIRRKPISGRGDILAALSANSLRMLNGEVRYRDMQSGRDIALSEFSVEMDDVQLKRPVHVHASGKLSGDAFSLDAEVGPLGDLGGFSVDKLPLQANIKAKSIALKKIATFIPALTGLAQGALGVDARIEQRPDGLRVAAGTLTWHGVHEVETGWKLEMPKADRLKLEHMSIRVDGEKVAGVSGSVRDIGRKAQYQLRINTPAISRDLLSSWMPDLRTMYAAHPAPWEQVRLGLLAAGDVSHVELRDVQLVLDKELVRASGNIRFGAAPRVRLRIAAGALHADPWLPKPEKSNSANASELHIIPQARAEDAKMGQARIGKRNMDMGGARIVRTQPVRSDIQQQAGAGTDHRPPDRQPAGQAKQDDEGAGQQPAAYRLAGAATSTEPDLRFLKPWHIAVGLQVDHLFLHGLDLGHLQATLSGKGGKFKLDPLRFELAGGQVSEKASLTVSRYPVRWSESVNIRGVQVQPVLMALADTDILKGVMQMETKLNGVGLLPAAAAGSLTGNGNVLLRDGMIKGFDIAGTLRNVMTFGQQSGPRHTDFSQLSGSFKVRNGIAKNDDLFMASPLFRLTGYGEVNLKNRSMDYHVKPRLVGSLAGQGDTETARKGLVIPLRIVGPLDAPRVKVEMNLKTLIGNAGSIKGLIKGKGGLKGILQGVLKGNAPDAAGPAPSSPPPTSPPPDNPVEQLRKRFKGLLPGF